MYAADGIVSLFLQHAQACVNTNVFGLYVTIPIRLSGGWTFRSPNEAACDHTSSEKPNGFPLLINDWGVATLWQTFMIFLTFLRTTWREGVCGLECGTFLKVIQLSKNQKARRRGNGVVKAVEAQKRVLFCGIKTKQRYCIRFNYLNWTLRN